MDILTRLLMESHTEWEILIQNYQQRNMNLKVPRDNSKDTLRMFNADLNDLYTEVEYDFARARRNKDAMERYLENVLDDYYGGSNPQARKAGGIQLARNFPAPEFYHEQTVNLFNLEDMFKWYYVSLQATIRSLQAKADAKITSNSLLNLEKSVTPY
jgi:hypothetical protein